MFASTVHKACSGVPACSKATSRAYLIPKATLSDQHARQVPVGNAFWLLDPMQDQYFNVRGQDFIIQRIEAASHIFPKLRLRKLHQRRRNIQRVPTKLEDMGRSGSVMVKSSQQQVPPVVFDDEPVIDITPMLELMEEAEELVSGQWSESADASPTTCCTAVHVPQTEPTPVDESAQEVFVSGSSSPRRTKMVGFTCLRCKARSYRPVNPKVFQEGTLVVQCGKCNVWHKIQDHLNLFHNMSGEIFPRRVPISLDDVPVSLRMPLEPFYWHQQEGDGSNN